VFCVDENAVSYTESELILLNVFALILNEVHIYSGTHGFHTFFLSELLFGLCNQFVSVCLLRTLYAKSPLIVIIRFMLSLNVVPK
jgi:hypothetical protein